MPLEQSLFADFPTVGGLAGHIAEQLAKAPVQAAPAAGANLSMQGAVGGTVGVTGMACRLAGVRSPEVSSTLTRHELFATNPNPRKPPASLSPEASWSKHTPLILKQIEPKPWSSPDSRAALDTIGP